MKKVLFIAASAALVFASCADNGKFDAAEQAIKDGTTVESAVSFDTYNKKTTSVTRAGTPGSINTEVLRKANYGFGVFAHYTGTSKWEEAYSETTPNFMWNQFVMYNTSSSLWTYEPMKYWPNDNSTADTDGATGSKERKQDQLLRIRSLRRRQDNR